MTKIDVIEPNNFTGDCKLSPDEALQRWRDSRVPDNLNVRASILDELFDDSIMKVYVMSCGDAVKVGISKNVGHRMAILRYEGSKNLGNDLKVRAVFTPEDVTKARKIESRAHHALSGTRILGHSEWFKTTVDSAINAITGMGDPK